MSQPTPLTLPDAWNIIAEAYDLDVVPWLETFAREALRLTAPAPDAVVLDVAAGPGTLSFVAARQVAKVVAIDFSEAMIERLRARVAREKTLRIESHVMDGQALSFADTTFDAAYSMFGLMFFPDRQKGMREILRVLKPGGPALLSSWAPIEKCPIASVGFGALRAAMPELPAPSAPPPLQDPAVFEDALREAGFVDVRVEVLPFEETIESPDRYWETFVRTSGSVVQLQRQLGPSSWAAVDERARAAVRAELGPDGPWKLGALANLAFGRKPR